MDRRVKFFAPNDMLHGYNLSKIENMHLPCFETIDINDAIEFAEIEKYFNRGVRCKDWTDDEYALYTTKSVQLSALSKRYFNQINDKNIIEVYNEVELGYRTEFWQLFNNCKLFNRISAEKFYELICGESINPRDLFLYKKIVYQYGKELRSFILEKNICIPIILHVYEQDYMQDEKLLLPAELTNEDIFGYIERYVDSKHPNVNHLKTIMNMSDTKVYSIPVEIRYRAKKRYEEESEYILKNGTELQYGIEVTFSAEQDEVIVYGSEERSAAISYSLKWLQDTLDYPSILNNFIYLFEFVDVPQMRSNHVNREALTGIFEKVYRKTSSRIYPCNHSFKFMQKLAQIQMEMYYIFLERQGVRLEEVVQWFFSEYLQQEFSCPEFRLFMPSANSTYAEKCSLINTALESVLKQYSLFVKYGTINFEFFGLSTSPISIAEVKSLIADKYMYGVGEVYKRIVFWLFSDQCMFSFVERLHEAGKSYDQFAKLVLNEEVFLSDYRENERNAFEEMASYDLLCIGNDGRITVKDKVKLAVLRDLYEKDVISYKHCPQRMIDAINDFLRLGFVEAESSLFSRPEIEYLSYLLNRQEFSNGLELRNGYMHGTLQVSNNEEEHRKNYFILLRLFILLVIKVNDEFTIKEEEKYRNNSCL